MPVRNYRVNLANATSRKLRLDSTHLCEGVWTPGGWEPAQTIDASPAPGNWPSASWQSESSASVLHPFPGTEGWVKYILEAEYANESDEHVYIHWQVPYLGTPVIPGYDRSSAQVTLSTITAHCEDSASGSTFSNASSTFELRWTLTQGSTEPTVAEFLAAYSNPASFVAAILSEADSHLNAWLVLRNLDSVRQALPRGYDAGRGLRALLAQGKTTSLRKLLGIR